MNVSQRRVRNTLNEIESLEKLKDFIETSTSFFASRCGTFTCRYERNGIVTKKKITVDDDVILKIIDCLIKEKNEQFEKDGVVF